MPQNQSISSLTQRQLDSSPTSDDAVNELYNVFSAEQMRTYNGINVRLNRNFRRRKTSNPEEWGWFLKIAQICEEHGFNPKVYVKWCFLQRLVPHGRGRTLKDAEYLTHYQQIAAFAQNRREIESLYKVYLAIMKSAMKIRNTTKEQNSSAAQVVKNVISSGRLTDYVSTGVISRYFISLIPNAPSVIYELTKNSKNEDLNVISDLCRTIPSYSARAAKSLKMFYPLALNRSILELCS